MSSREVDHNGKLMENTISLLNLNAFLCTNHRILLPTSRNYPYYFFPADSTPHTPYHHDQFSDEG